MSVIVHLSRRARPTSRAPMASDGSSGAQGSPGAVSRVSRSGVAITCAIAVCMACGGPPSAETDASGDTRAAIRQDARQDAPTDVRAASALGSPREATPGDSGALPGAAHDPSDGSSPEGEVGRGRNKH